MVVNDKKVVVFYLSLIFQVMEEIICCDFEKFEDEGFLICMYGGVVLNIIVLFDNIYFYKCVKFFFEEKQIIVCNVLLFIKNKIIMVVDFSSMVMELLKLLKERNDFMLLINLVEVFYELVQLEINVVFIGGELNKNMLLLQGRIIKEIISCYYVDIMVMSCKGLDMKNGVFDFNEVEVEIKKMMICQVMEVVLLVDYFKFDCKVFVQLVDFSYINYFIINKVSGVEWIVFCKENNI